MLIDGALEDRDQHDPPQFSPCKPNLVEQFHRYG
jgi:hypothetical protein